MIRLNVDDGLAQAARLDLPASSRRPVHDSDPLIGREHRPFHTVVIDMSQLKLNGVSILSDLFGWGTGAANRIRTCHPVITNDVLYQLSYCGGKQGQDGKQ